jgi:hypothetical protein
MKKNRAIIKRILIIAGVFIGGAILGVIFGHSITKIITTALAFGGLAFFSTGEKEIKRNDRILKNQEKEYEKSKKKINNTNYDNYNLAADPINIQLHERIKLQRDKRDNR